MGAIGVESTESLARRLVESLEEYIGPDAPDELGALKKFNLPREGEGATRAIARFTNEVNALKMIEGDPAVLRVLEFHPDEHWMITDYHEGGSLSNHPEVFKGNLFATLQALRPIVAALAKLHEKGIVHRDIKPQNIFLSRTNQLVLGDFGIVFFETGLRPTELLERVGSRDWMAPWGHTGMKVDDVKPTFDVFPLGKVFWSMVSGRPMLPYWYHRRRDYDLTVMFPDDPTMHVANRILDTCVVENEEDCLFSAADLLIMIDAYLKMLANGGQLLSKGVPRPCRVCGMGEYQSANDRFPGFQTWDVYACDHCDNIQCFGKPQPR